MSANGKFPHRRQSRESLPAIPDKIPSPPLLNEIKHERMPRVLIFDGDIADGILSYRVPKL